MTAQTERCVRELEKLGARVARTIIFEVTSELIKSTPVDTGWARANWIPSLGAPNTTRRTARPTSSIVPAAVAEQNAGLAQVAAIRLGQSGFISNNVPYISALDGGSSRQEPAGFVQRSVQRGVQKAARAFAR